MIPVPYFMAQHLWHFEMQTTSLSRTYFPLDLATGVAFVGRSAELGELRSLIKQGQHVWIQGPRRWGKSSLIRQALHGQDCIDIRCDLLGTTGIDNACDLLMNRIADSASRLTSGTKNAIERIQEAFRDLEVSLSLKDAGVRLKFERDESSIPQFLSLALSGLDALAIAEGKRVVLVIDEFQALSDIDKDHHVEGWIRGGIQGAKNVMAIFSGSNRTLLADMFTNPKRPLYRMCRSVEIGPVSEAGYSAHLAEAFSQQWGGDTDAAVIQAILAKTECHPYVTNLCCQLLMDQPAKPDLEGFSHAWEKVVRHDRSYQAERINGLNNSDKKVLRALAIAPTAQPRSAAYLTQFGLASSTMGLALDRLVQQDLILQEDRGTRRFRVFDPILREVAGR